MPSRPLNYGGYTLSHPSNLSTTLLAGKIRTFPNIGTISTLPHFPIPTPTPIVNPSPSPSPTSPPTSTSPTPTTPSNLVPSILAIPVAVEGQPITSDYHNSARGAILAIASLLGASLTGQTVTRTFAPAFFADNTPPLWQQDLGFAHRPAGAATASGWFPVQLPDGARIESMTVFGARSGTMTSFQIQLFRQDLSIVNLPLISIELSQTQTDFSLSGISGSVSIPGLNPGSVEEYKNIDNTKFKYVVQASLTGAAEDAVANITAVQIQCQMT